MPALVARFFCQEQHAHSNCSKSMLRQYGSVGNESLEFESRIESRVIHVESRVESFRPNNSSQVASFLPRLESFHHFNASV